MNSALRQAPMGIVLMAAVFAMIAVTSIAAGGWLLVSGGSGSLWGGVVAAVAGPAILYLSYHLVLRTRWAWSAVLVLVSLLFLSSLIRLAVTPSLAISVVAELFGELLVGFYLTRPGIRGAFGWSSNGASDAPE